MNTNNDVYNVYFKDAFGKTITDGIAIINDPKVDEFRGKAVTNTDDINLADVSAFLDVTGLQYCDDVLEAVRELMDFVRTQDDSALYDFVNNVYEIELNVDAISCQAELNNFAYNADDIVDIGDTTTDEVDSFAVWCSNIDPDKFAKAVLYADEVELPSLITEDNDKSTEGCS